MSAIMRNEACRKVFLSARKSLDQKMESAVRSMIGYSKHSESDSLGELGFGSCLLLALISALSNSELMLSAALLELSASYSPLKSSHFTAWLVEDYTIDIRVVQKALEQLFRIDRSGLFSVPGHMRKLLLELARQSGIRTDSFPNEDLLAGTEEDAEASGITTEENVEANSINTEDNAEASSRITTEENVEASCINTEGNAEASSRITTEENVEANCINTEGNADASSITIEKTLEANNIFAEENAQEDHVEDSAVNEGACSNARVDHFPEENVAGDGGSTTNTNAENSQEENVAGDGGSTTNTIAGNSQEEDAAGAAENGGFINNTNAENSESAESSTETDIKTMVINAVITDSNTTLEELVAGGADLSMTTDDGQSLLHLAAREGCINTAKALIQLGARLNRKDRQGLTPLQKAVQADNTQMIQLLIELGVNTSYKLFWGETMLMFAVANSSFSAASPLLNHGMHINDKNNSGDTVLHTVLKEYKNTVQSLTLEQRKLTSSRIHNIVKFISDHNGDINITNAAGETAFHIAAGIADAEVVHSLVAAGAVANVKNNVGDTPLHIATRNSNIAVVKYLLNARVVVDVQNNVGDTPLHIATSSNNYAILEKLVSSSCSSIAIKNTSGKSPLHLAVSCRSINCLEILLESTENVDIEDNAGYTPLCTAAEIGVVPIVEMLCKENVEIIHAIKDSRKTPLHLAAEMGHTDIVNVLLDKGADVQAKAKEYMWKSGGLYWKGDLSPLHYAAQGGHLSIVQSLVERGANIQAIDRGSTPLDYATRHNKHDVASFLRTKMR